MNEEVPQRLNEKQFIITKSEQKPEQKEPVVEEKVQQEIKKEEIPYGVLLEDKSLLSKKDD